jgi:glycerophosphoryl diester phosphodiesterase
MNNKLKKMKNKLKYAALIFFIGLSLYSIKEPEYKPNALPVNYDLPKVIAHKALISDKFPGNSLSAIKEALSTNIGGIEIDIRRSKDGILFLYHGDTLEETTNHQGIPELYNWADLAQVKYKNTEEKLVSLDDFFTLVGKEKVSFIHIKSSNKIVAYAVVDYIKRYKLEKYVLIESFDPIILAAIRLYSSDIILMYDFVDNAIAIGEESQSQFDQISWFLKNHWFQKQVRRIIQPDVLGPRFNLDPEILQSLISHNYQIVSWTVDDFKTAQALYKAGVKGLQSNKPLIIDKKD